MSVEKGEDLPDVPLGLRIRRDSAVPGHRACPSIVGSQRQRQIPVVPGDQATKVPRPSVNVLPGIEGVADAHKEGRVRHELHQPPGPLWRNGVRDERRFDPDDGPNELGRQPESGGRFVDLCRVATLRPWLRHIPETEGPWRVRELEGSCRRRAGPADQGHRQDRSQQLFAQACWAGNRRRRSASLTHGAGWPGGRLKGDASRARLSDQCAS